MSGLEVAGGVFLMLLGLFGFCFVTWLIGQAWKVGNLEEQIGVMESKIRQLENFALTSNTPTKRRTK